MKWKKGTIVRCIKDVIMSTDSELDPNKRMFTKDKYYRTYPHAMEDGWGFKNVVCAKNDLKERHIVINEGDMSFFNEHFIVIEIG